MKVLLDEKKAVTEQNVAAVRDLKKQLEAAKKHLNSKLRERRVLD